MTETALDRVNAAREACEEKNVITDSPSAVRCPEKLLRTVWIKPYVAGHPRFRLRIYDTGEFHNRGPQWALGYELDQFGPYGKAKSARVRVFESEGDYGCAPGDAIDSDASIAGLCSFLGLRPGDTDAEFFERYTDEQLEFALTHGESFSLEASTRFGED